MDEFKIKVTYIGYISHIVGKKNEEITIKDNTSLFDLLNVLGKKYGERFINLIKISDKKLRNGVLIQINGLTTDKFDGYDTKLVKNQEVNIVLMSPLGGG